MSAGGAAAGRELFEWARAKVTDMDIRCFAQDDLGRGCWQELVEIRQRGGSPGEWTVGDPAVIQEAMWAKEGSHAPWDYFLRYRVFCVAVVLRLAYHSWRAADNDAHWIPNYIACRLTDDSRQLRDPELQRLAAEALEALPEAAEAARWLQEEGSYCILGAMLLQQNLGDFHRTDALAAELIKREGEARQAQAEGWGVNWGSEFLLGLSCFDSLHADWLKLIDTLKNPNRNEEMQLVIDAFGAVRRWRK